MHSSTLCSSGETSAGAAERALEENDAETPRVSAALELEPLRRRRGAVVRLSDAHSRAAAAERCTSITILLL